MSYRYAFSLVALAFGLLHLAVRPAPAQPRTPPPPPAFDVEIHYRIFAARNQRARAFQRLLEDLKGLGFQRDPDDAAAGEDKNEVENVKATRLKGTIPPRNARLILRNPYVRTIRLVPAGVKLPAADQPVRVDLTLAAELSPSRQRVLAADLVSILKMLGFRQGVGYDQRQFTRLLGSLPAGKIETLLNDVRRSPVAWGLLPRTLLSDLRRFEGGALVLQATLEEWQRDPEGKKLIGDMVAAWGLQKPALEYISRLPVEVRRNEDVVQELLLVQVQRIPEGNPFLAKLLAAVFKSKSGPVLVDALLTRLEGRTANLALPPFFRGSRVLSVIEARPDYPLPVPRPAPVKVPDTQLKLTPGVRKLPDANERRLELILNTSPADTDTAWERELVRVVPNLIVEGRVGPVVAVRCKPADALKLSALQLVSTVRLPRPAESALLVLPDEGGDPAKVLAATGLDRLHRAGRRGQKVRVAVVADDFRGWQALVGKRLPKTTRYLDLTAERSDILKPDPFPNKPGTGGGVTLALAVLLAAPDCELTLVRIDAAAPYMLNVLLRRLNGADYTSASLTQRRDDLGRTRRQMRRRLDALLKEREEVLNLFADNKPQPKESPELQARQRRRDAYFMNQKRYDEDERAFDAVVKAYVDYRAGLAALRDVRVVVCGLNWLTGLPVDGSGALARYLDDSPLRPLWFQAAGNNRGQAWTGLFRDTKGDSVMEFADPRTPLPAGNWDHDVNFLAWQPLRGPRVRLLPAGTKVRVTLQWREPHDPDFARQGDPYRVPLADPRLVVFRQPDPEGTKQPSDDLVVTAESVGLPQRIDNRPDAATYQYVVEFPVAAAGRYGLRVEGFPGAGTHPLGAPTLPAVRRFGELRPRIFVETAGGDGRVVFDSYATDGGTVGTPGDAVRALTVAAVDAAGQAQPYSTEGTPYNIELASKPEVYSPDRLGLEGAKNVGGTGLSAAFAAGHAAALLSGGATPERVRQALRLQSRKMLRIPKGD